jgi:hypothetical protein
LHVGSQAEASTRLFDKIQRLIYLRIVEVRNDVDIAGGVKFAGRGGAINPEFPLVGTSKVCEFLAQSSEAGADFLHTGFLAIRKRLDFGHTAS